MLEHLRLLSSFPPDVQKPVPAAFLRDVAWWGKFMDTYNGVSIISQARWSDPDVIFTTDACLTGCGGHTHNSFFHSRFPAFIAGLNLHINALELLTVDVELRLWGSQLHGLKVCIFCDKETSVCVLNSGRTHDPFLVACLWEMAFLAAHHEFKLRSQHLSTTDNRIADLLSRWDKNKSCENEFFAASGLLPENEVVVPEEYFKFINNW